MVPTRKVSCQRGSTPHPPSSTLGVCPRHCACVHSLSTKICNGGQGLLVQILTRSIQTDPERLSSSAGAVRWAGTQAIAFGQALLNVFGSQRRTQRPVPASSGNPSGLPVPGTVTMGGVGEGESFTVLARIRLFPPKLSPEACERVPGVALLGAIASHSWLGFCVTREGRACGSSLPS